MPLTSLNDLFSHLENTTNTVLLALQGHFGFLQHYQIQEGRYLCSCGSHFPEWSCTEQKWPEKSLKIFISLLMR